MPRARQNRIKTFDVCRCPIPSSQINQNLVFVMMVVWCQSDFSSIPMGNGRHKTDTQEMLVWC